MSDRVLDVALVVFTVGMSAIIAGIGFLHIRKSLTESQDGDLIALMFVVFAFGVIVGSLFERVGL